MTRRRLRVVAAVIERGAEILVSYRHPKGLRPSQWEFPGGKVERGETEVQALVREIREELGVESEIGALVRRHVHSYDELDVEIAFYRTRIVSGEPQPLSMVEIRWVHRRDLGSLDFLEADRAFVAELIRGRFQAARRARGGAERGSVERPPVDRSPVDHSSVDQLSVDRSPIAPSHAGSDAVNSDHATVERLRAGASERR